MIDPATQAFMADRMGAVVRAHRVDQRPLITRPDTVVDIVTEAVEFVHRSDHAAAHPIVS